MYVILKGNPVDGLSVIGPFATPEEAIEVADLTLTVEYDWWITPLEEPPVIHPTGDWRKL